MKNIAILGSSGSIGKNALWVASRFPEELRVYALSVNTDIATLTSQIEECSPSVVCVADEKAAEQLKAEFPNPEFDILTGEDGLTQIAAHPDVDIVLNAVVGFAGLKSTLSAAKAGKRIALANKESMVAGGDLVNEYIKEYNAEIIPVDSEHSAIFQCLKSGRATDVKRIILTASGGPFREYPKDKFEDITVEQALDHPTWNMGRKITIDSATLMNKALEIIEAFYLFGVASKQIDVVVHPQSIVHSMVEFTDGATIAQLSKPDMRLPIQYALFYPERSFLDTANLDFTKQMKLDFFAPDYEKFPSLKLAYKALEIGGTAPAVLNAANEVAVELFLEKRIKFTDIFKIVRESIDKYSYQSSNSIESIIDADNFGRSIASNYIAKK